MIHNPHLEGGPFFWKGGETGVLLVHGYTATTAEVRYLGEALHEAGYTVAGPLLPGHHSHPLELNRTHWRDWLSEVEKAYADLAAQSKRIYVGGESTGALLALYLASERPEIAGILAYAPALKLTLNPALIALLYVMAPFIPYTKKRGLETETRWQGYNVYPLRGAIQLLRLQRVVMDRLGAIHQPVLVIQGRQDPTVHPRVPDLIARKVSSEVREIHWMEKSRHCVAIDSECERVVEITLQFIKRL